MSRLPKVYEFKCKGCGIPFKARRKDKVYHSQTCKYKDWLVNKHLRELEIAKAKIIIEEAHLKIEQNKLFLNEVHKK